MTAIRLRRIELRGFKTFAPPTIFEFVDPLTAIVGPNGSGKSNVADAVRWVLGEQSLRLLRARKTEDVIFAGSVLRPPVGLAEVQLILDNSDGWLPLPHAEVTITRRAHRSGENEYLVNRQPVRLRDYLDLLLRANVSQHAYSVIGQGMVDAALSQRPEERRAMFEEAADLKRFQAKLAQAQQHLAATEQNLQRVSDILAELTPRLAALERLAERAARHASVEHELLTQLVRWHRHRWRRAQLQVEQAARAEATAQDAVAQARAALDAALAEVDALDAERRGLEERTAALRVERDARRAALARLERDLAVARERGRALAEQRAALARDAEALAAQQSAVERAVAELAREHEARQAERAHAATELAALDEDRPASPAAEHLAQVQARVADVAARWAALQRERAQLAERQAAYEREQQAREAERARLAVESAALATERARRTAALAEVEHSLAAAAGELDAAQATLAAVQQAHDAARQQLEEMRRALASVRARAEVLERLDRELAGYHAGARAVLRAGRNGRLSGVLGAIGALLRVPPHLEQAISATLGGRVQDVVVERWADAEAAIAWLKQTQAGRATFLPLDALRVFPAKPPASGLGILGLAADLVPSEPRLGVVVQHLLGRTLVVDDLPTARRILAACPPGWQLVTLDGEIVRASGAVTGGSAAQGGELLTRERETRELPREIAALERQVAAAQAAEQAARAAFAVAEAQVRALATRERDGLAQRQSGQAELAALEREQARLERLAASAPDDDPAARAAAVAVQLAATEAALATVSAEQEALAVEHAAARAAVEAAQAAAQEQAAVRAQRRTALALLTREVEHAAQALAEREREQQRLAAAWRERTSQVAALVEAAAAQEAACERLGAGLAEADAAVAEVEAALEPGEAGLRQAGAHQRALDAAARARRDDLAAAEARLAQAQLVRQHAADELAAQRRQIAAEWADDAEEEGDDAPRQLRLLLPGAPAEPTDDWLLPDPDAIRRRVETGRQQLRALGAVDPAALAEHRVVAERHAFLTGQAEDLRRAAADLRQATADLERVMREQFERAFAAVNREFRHYFRQLFGGGHARLELTAPEDPANTGVEIIAQPPGRRLQSVGALSGGERALTATALLFALLRVHPTPFCVLDEADAALDEANIQRFLDALRGLLDRTQVIVITHNRATMTAAGALYGVTMGQDAVSRVLSLRLDDVPLHDDGAAAAG
ncbi:MAG: chromosome segregation protein SMC [Chloroflexi bacterium]|nr:chromosome segregation protein SMC [Chloroflexota bacterium]